MHVDYLYEQGTGQLNEDFYFTNGSLFGVFDGATSLTKDLYENDFTGGFLASNIAGDTFSKNNSSLIDLAEKANLKISDAMLKRGVNINSKENLWSTSLAVVRIHEERFQWVQTGDCLVLAIYDDDSFEVLTKGFDHDLETLMMWKEISESPDDTILEKMSKKIAEVRSQMNVTYGVLNGEKEALNFLRIGEKSLKGIKNIIIFTDGLFIPKENPEDKEDFNLFTSLYLKGGLHNVKDYIRTLEETDNNCTIFPRFKTHDDIAAVSLTF
jgi:serine/threonine protein phosphatase PrpC